MAKKEAAPVAAKLADKKAVTRSFQDRLGIVTSALTPSKVADAIAAASQGQLGELQEMYMKMASSDARYSGLLQSLRSSLSSFPVRVQEGKAKNAESALARELVEDMLFSRPDEFKISEIIKALTRPYVSSIGIWELMYSVRTGPDGKPYYYWTGMELVAPGRYGMDMRQDSPDFGQVTISVPGESQGKSLDQFPAGKLLFITDGAEKGFFDLGGAARRCLSWYLCKIYSQKSWAEYNEVYVEPTRIAKVPAGMSDTDLDNVEKAISKLGKALYAVLPDDVMLDFVQMTRDGSPKTYEDLITLSNDEISIAILGQLQTSDGGKTGSYAKAAIQNIVRFEIIQSIAAMAEEGIAEAVRNVMIMNFGEDFDRAAYPKVKIVSIRPGDALTKSQMFTTAAKLVEIPAAHIRDELGLPEPVDGEEVVFFAAQKEPTEGRGQGDLDDQEAGDEPTPEEGLDEDED